MYFFLFSLFRNSFLSVFISSIVFLSLVSSSVAGSSSYLNCNLDGRVVVAWTVTIVAVFDGFDHIQRFEFEPKDPSNVICGDYTSATPPADGHVCLMYNSLGESSVRVRACNSAGCGNWSGWSTVTFGARECVLRDGCFVGILRFSDCWILWFAVVFDVVVA